jgi:hypothetical protein
VRIESIDARRLVLDRVFTEASSEIGVRLDTVGVDSIDGTDDFREDFGA